MKVQKVKSKRILLLYLLIFKTYEQTIFKKSANIFFKHYLIEILFNLKKSLKIIFNYHKKNKLILFIGLPKDLKFKINKFTTHIAFSKFLKLDGNVVNILNNNENKKPYLIVLFNTDVNVIIQESYLAKIPLICINNNLINKNFYHRNIYKVSINQNRKVFQILNNFFCTGLRFLFK